MTKVQLTDTAENIVNQIISSDAVEVSFGPVCGLHAYTDNIDMSDEGIAINTKEDDDCGVPFISNNDLNKAKIKDGVIIIPIENNHFWDLTISLYKLNKIVAIN
ncbi:MAG: hypothetical protein ACO3UU_02040 [Minisyncoccia bacterium]|jgi:hypothetical protein